MTRRIPWHQTFCLVLVLMLAGCAAEHSTNGIGGTIYRLDPNEIFGVKIGDFDTPNGKAVLRQNRNGSYSIKISNTMKVIDVGRYSNVSIVKSLGVGNEQVVILQTSDSSCERSYLMYVFSPTKDYGVVKLGNCRSAMEFRSDGQTLTAYEVGSVSPRSWEYHDQKLTEAHPAVPSATARKVRATRTQDAISPQRDQSHVVQKRAAAINIGASPGKVSIPQDTGRAIPRISLEFDKP